MHDQDYPRRVHFAQYCRAQMRNSADFLSRIVFSDECMFRVNGSVNTQNVRIWGTENPYSVHEEVMNSPGIMAWCAMSEDRIIGPYFFENGNVTGASYRNMLNDYAFPRFQNLRNDYIFQQDGAPAHTFNLVKAYLDTMRPNCWIGKRGPTPWPARSPDLTPCDFFLWGYIKSKVYETPVGSIEQLKRRIRRVVRSIDTETLQNVWKNLKFRLDYTIHVNGQRIEHLIQ